MNRKLKSLLMAAIIAAGFTGTSVTAATNPMESKSITIDKDFAKRDSLIHRLDGLSKSAFNESKGSNTSKESNASSTSNSSSTLNSSNAGNVEKPAVKAYEKNNKPNRIVTTIKGDPKSSRGFNWYTSENLESFVLISEKEDMSNPVEIKAEGKKMDSHYVERDEKGFFLFQLMDKKSGEVKKYFTDEGKNPGWDSSEEITDKENESVKIDITKVEEYSYKAVATDLKPSTTYYYQVGSKDGGMSEVGTFKTASDKADKLTFLHYTDTQNAFYNEKLIDEAAYGADTIKKALALAPEADFVLHTGDIVEIAEVEDEWVDLFEKSKESFLKTTLAFAPGNHDEYGLNYDERFLNKYTDHVNVDSEGKDDGGTYYSYDYNGVHFIVLNTNDYKNDEVKAVGKEQMEWIKKDVEKARANGAKWIILNFHKPIYSKSYHSLQDTDVQNVKEDLMKLIDELDIDLALQGHDHVLSRTKSLKYATKDKSPFFAEVAENAEKKDGVDYLINPKGTTFILPNTGGTKAYDDIYSKGLEHVIKVRPKLNWLTEETLKQYNDLFAFGEQPQKAPEFEKSHSNNRNSKIQNFAKYTIEGGMLTVELYQIEGDLTEKREPKLIDSFKIEKKN